MRTMVALCIQKMKTCYLSKHHIKHYSSSNQNTDENEFQNHVKLSVKH